MPLKYRGIGVHISCDEKELNSYAPETTEDKNLSQCYIASEAGKEFKIIIQNLDATQVKTSKVAKIILDGYDVRCSLLDGKRTTIPLDKIIVSPTKSRPFQFAKIETRDDDGVPMGAVNLERLGTIEVILCRAYRNYSKKDAVATGGPVPVIGPISEQAKKIGWHRISFGQEATIEPVQYVTTTWIDSLSSPYAVFRFRYQPKELLQARGIIPRAPVIAAIRPAKIVHKASDPCSANKGKKRPAPMDELDSRETKRGILQNHRQETVPSRLETSSNELVVKVEPANSPTKTADALRALRDSIQAAQKTMLAAQAQIERMERRQSQVSRRPSPIRVGRANGKTIDLTLDDD